MSSEPKSEIEKFVESIKSLKPAFMSSNWEEEIFLDNYNYILTDNSSDNEYICIKTIISDISNINKQENITGKNNAKYIEYNITDFLNNSNINCTDDVINDIRNQIKNGSLDSYITNNILGDKQDILLNDTNIHYQITSSENQNKNDYDDISSIILGNCEKILKDEYKIDQSQALIIFKIDYYQPGSLIPIIGYEIFHPETKKKLDLKYCEEEFIKYNIPVDINEDNLFMYDPNDEYYTDQCYPSTTDSGTDILINDRQNEYNSNNMSICENSCTLTKYETDSKKAICECGVKSKQLVISELINQTDLLSYNFTTKSQSSNMITMKCYYTLFTKSGLIKNIGSYILLFTIILFLISGILFYKCGYHLLEDEIKEIMNTKEENSKQGLNIIKTIEIPNKKGYNTTNNKIKKAKTKNGKKKKIKKKKNLKISQINKIQTIGNNSSEIPKSFAKLETNINEHKLHSKNIQQNIQNSIIY